jgi:hypothetical protein
MVTLEVYVLNKYLYKKLLLYIAHCFTDSERGLQTRGYHIYWNC